MTNTLSLRSLDIPSIHKFGVGFDTLFDELAKSTSQSVNYPPYNVVKHSENQFVIELAVAGFKEGEITLTTKQNVLTVNGEKTTELAEGNAKPVEYLHRGISQRGFTRTFTLADHVEVVDATVENGILSISLERKIPETLRPKTIAISFNK